MAFYVKVKTADDSKTVFVTCNPTDTVATVLANYEKMTEEEPAGLLDADKKPLDKTSTLVSLETDMGSVFYLA